jgi:hypothetical protein
VHRLWEPLAAKQRPPNGYAAQIRHALSARHRLRARRRRARAISPMNAVRDRQVLALAGQGALRDRSG